MAFIAARARCSRHGVAAICTPMGRPAEPISVWRGGFVHGVLLGGRSDLFAGADAGDGDDAGGPA
jgi:hypothetical protein